jgi:hypothetical protein
MLGSIGPVPLGIWVSIVGPSWRTLPVERGIQTRAEATSLVQSTGTVTVWLNAELSWDLSPGFITNGAEWAPATLVMLLQDTCS